MKKYNLHQIMIRAWALVKESAMTISAALRRAWAEAKAATKDLVEVLTANLDQMAYNDYHIHAGYERRAVSKLWEKGDEKRAYLAIRCYTYAGRFKRSYKAGYVDLVSNQYVIGKWDDVDAEKMECISR